MNRCSRIVAAFPIFFLTTLLTAQINVSGTVTDASTGNSLAGANVVVDGTGNGAAADASGSFTINNVPNGATLTASMIGYTNVSMSAATTLNFKLIATAVELSGLEVLASRADDKTPVAFTTVTKEEMETRLGSQDIPMALNFTPSVYATQQGGGAGDARINVRGFNQRNVAVMINGVPQNDMENGWVYWSNWDGVGDATSSIQMQRGLSAVNLATPSIGGTMNIITDPAAHDQGGSFKQEAGAGSFLKTTLNYNTGLINDKLALSGTLVRKTGQGVIDKTWTDAWSYYLGASYQVNDGNRLELYAIGAPQRHGQNLYKQNIATYSQELAGDIAGYNDSSFAIGEEFDYEAGRYFNQNWSPVDASYTGKQYWYMYGEKTVDRHDPNFLNERENFFHKPLVNLNHFMKLTDQLRLSSVLYWSGGSGGGTGTYGDVARFDTDGKSDLDPDGHKFYYGNSPWTWDWNGTINANSSSASDVVVFQRDTVSRGDKESIGILRNSINRQNTYGLISKLNFDLGDLQLQTGIDWRTAGIEHAREVRDLLGGDHYVDYADDNVPDGKVVRLGDIIAYHNSTTVDWLGFFGQASFTAGSLSGYGMFGMSTIGYSYQDHFTVANAVITSDNISTMQYKGGAMFDLSESLSLFANYGNVEKPPIMDNVIYYDGTVAPDPSNEVFESYETGFNYRSGVVALKGNYYNTDWKDRNLTKAVTTGQGSSGDTDVIFLTGVNQNHSGVEMEVAGQLNPKLRVDAAMSVGHWSFTEDAVGNYQETDYDTSGNAIGLKTTPYSYALSGLYVGDMPQTSYAAGVTFELVEGLKTQVLYNIYDNNYADWSPDSREYDGEDTNADRTQVWEAPGYSKMDIHINYDLPLDVGGSNVQLFAHIFNALDNVYVQDAVDHSQYNSYGDKVHAAHNAEVFLGTPRYFNAGLKINF